jgi:hypothetical protein
MIKSREEIKAAAIAASIKEREKGKKKKHPMNNNGPREKYNKAAHAERGEEGSGLLAEIAPATAAAPVAARKEEVAAPVMVVEAAATPAPPPVKRTKPKVVKF